MWNVVVPLCFELKLIKHKGSASLSDVELCKMSMPILVKRTKPCGVSSLTGYKVSWPGVKIPQSGQIDCVPTPCFDRELKHM